MGRKDMPNKIKCKCPSCGYGSKREESLPIYPPGSVAPNIAVICPHCGFTVKVEIKEGKREFAKLTDFAQFFYL